MLIPGVSLHVNVEPSLIYGMSITYYNERIEISRAVILGRRLVGLTLSFDHDIHHG